MARYGECARLVDTIDWASSSLGPRESWSPALRSMVADMLHARQPMLLFWGPDLLQFYNDAFVPSFGQGKHPAAMGQRAAECWADAWPLVGAQIDAVMTRGEPAWFADALVPIYRNGRMEEVFWTYSYSPAFDIDGSIAGTLVIVTEMTGRVVAARRLAALATLTGALADATSRTAALAAVDQVAADHRADLPLVRLLEPPPALGLVTLAAPVTAAPWPEPVTSMLVAELPSGAPTAQLALGLGVSPRLPFDDAYRSFLEQIVAQVATAFRRIDHAVASRAAEEQRDNLLMQAPVGTALLTGPDHVFALANALYCAIAGRDPTGQTFAAAFPELAGGEWHRILDGVYRTGAGVAVKERPARLERDGLAEDRWFDTSVQPLRGPTGAVYGMMIVAVDVTEQVRASCAKDEFLAMLGHELRNPLAPIAAAVALMKQKDAATKREQELIERHLGHVTRLVDDLLDVARITRGTIELRRRSVDLAAAVERALEIASYVIEQRGHRVFVDVPAGLHVHADEGRLIQIVNNLVSNAARYTPPGGTIEVTGAERDGQAELRVSDNGIGMDRELLDHVFDLFVQGKRGTDRVEGGLGIGLALVKNLITLHGGTVTATSGGPGAGSTLTVTLPLADEAPMTAARSLPLPVARRGRRVMIVDDNEDAAMLLGELVHTCGHEIAIAHDPQAALRMVREFEPDVVVLDIGLPGMDGYTLASRIRALPVACRFIALTGYGQEQDRARALQAGFEAHFVKPVALTAFLDLLS